LFPRGRAFLTCAYGGTPANASAASRCSSCLPSSPAPPQQQKMNGAVRAGWLRCPRLWHLEMVVCTLGEDVCWHSHSTACTVHCRLCRLPPWAPLLHRHLSAAQGSSTAVSRSDTRLIQHLDSSARGLVRRWRFIGYSLSLCVCGGTHRCPQPGPRAPPARTRQQATRAEAPRSTVPAPPSAARPARRVPGPAPRGRSAPPPCPSPSPQLAATAPPPLQRPRVRRRRRVPTMVNTSLGSGFKNSR
jgi:hypothetical protein